MSETPPPILPPRKKLAVEQPLGNSSAVRWGGVWMYALATVALIGIALYMALLERRELLSGYVAGPAIGALWFGLRTFMMMGGRER